MIDNQKYKASEEQILEFYLAQCRLLGYPECCGRAYHKVDKPEHAPEPQRSIYMKYGWFFPCVKHANQLQRKEKTIFEVINLDNRNVAMPIFKASCDNRDLEIIHKKTVEILLAEDPEKWCWIKL